MKQWSRPSGRGHCHVRGRTGYDGLMSENSNERETPDVGLVPDEDLPEDLQPTDDNPLAQAPSETGDTDEDSGGDGPSGEPKVDGLPDMGEPGV